MLVPNFACDILGLIIFTSQDMPQLDELFTSVEQYDNMNIQYLSVSVRIIGVMIAYTIAS